MSAYDSIQEFLTEHPDYHSTHADLSYRLFVNENRTVLVRLWVTGAVEVATRPDAHATWGPPIACKEER